MNAFKHYRLRDTSRPDMTRGTKYHVLTSPVQAEGVEVVYTTDELKAEKWLKEHITYSSAKAVGFDIEHKPQFTSKRFGCTENETAVLQLAVETSCLVLHIYYMSALPKSLESILRDERVLKIGSGIKQDAVKVQRDTGLVCKGLVDTQAMAKDFGLRKVGLAALAEYFLHIDLDKSMALSNWEIIRLKLPQIEYAALDAWVGLQIYKEMKRQKRVQDQEMIKEALDIHQQVTSESLYFYARKVETETSFAFPGWFAILAILIIAFVLFTFLSELLLKISNQSVTR